MIRSHQVDAQLRHLGGQVAVGEALSTTMIWPGRTVARSRRALATSCSLSFAAVAVVGVAPEGRALNGRRAGRTGRRNGVEEPEPIVDRGSLPGQVLERSVEQSQSGSDSFVIAGLLGQVGEEVTEPGVGEAQQR